MTKTRQWSLLTAVAGVLVLLVGWVLLISPQRHSAANYASQVTSQQSTNDGLRQQIAVLESEKKGLPQEQQKIAADLLKVPSNDPQLPTLIRTLQADAVASDVDLSALTKSSMTPVTGTGSAVPATTTATTPTTATTATSAAAASSAPSGLQQIPVTLTVSGSYFNIEQFVYGLESLQRAMRVTSLSIASNSTTGPSGGSAPATTATGSNAKTGELTATIQATVFETLDATTITSK